ncbi:MAG: BTAD domain-containing putative transcriptional regulator [Acidimicrobiia bacterium]
MVADTRKAGALLAYLTVEGVTRRDVLSALLWPESPDAQARATLRRTLSALRSAAGAGAIEADRDQVRLTPDAHSDVAIFDSALAETTTHDHGEADVCFQCIPLLERAVGVYRGDFMSGFSLRGTPEFENWVRITAETYRLACGGAFDSLASAYAAQGDYARAVSAVKSWIDLDPLREPAYRRLMLLYAWAGDRAGAMETYRRCVAVLDEELGVNPLEETTELHEAILDDDLPPAPSHRRRLEVKPSAPTQSDDMLDRESELAVLTEAARNPAPGRIIRLAGEPWMGKTRLLEEMKSAARGAAVPVAQARAYRAETGLPYGVVRQLLDSLAATPQWAGLSEHIPPWARAESARIHPALGDPPAGVADEALGETRLFDSLHSVFICGPMLVTVDDAQWADPASMSFLAYLAHRISLSSTLFVFAHRLEDSSLLTPLLEASVTAEDLILAPLTEADLVDQLPDSDRAKAVVARTGGVPALVAEAIQSDAGSPLTPGIRRFMEVRLADLDDLTQQVMVAAAVLHGTCDIDLLQATSGRSDEEVTSAAERLLDRRIFFATPEGEVGFQLDGMEHLVYEETSLLRRRLLHRRAAAAIESSPRRTQNEAASAAQIALHHQAGGQEEAAAEWYLRAGDLARGVFANAEATEAYRAALALGHPEVSRLHMALGDTLLFEGRFSAAQTEFEKAAGHGTTADRALAEHRIGEAHRRLGRLELALARFQSAEEDHPEPVSLYSDWALALLRSGDRKRARAKADRAVVAAEESDRSGRSRARAVLGMVTPHKAEAERMLREALDLAGDDPILRMAALNALAHNLGQSGSNAEAVELVNEALAIAARIGDRHRQGALYNHLADLHHQTGRRSDAEAALTEAVKLLVEIEPGSWEPEIWLLTRW